LSQTFLHVQFREKDEVKRHLVPAATVHRQNPASIAAGLWRFGNPTAVSSLIDTRFTLV